MQLGLEPGAWPRLRKRVKYYIDTLVEESIAAIPFPMDVTIVDPGGKGDHTTLAAAVTAASAGDVIAIGPGTYDEGNISINKKLFLFFLPGALIRYSGTDVYVLRFTGAAVGSVLRGADIDRTGIYASGSSYILQIFNLNAGALFIEESILFCTPTNASYDNAAVNVTCQSGHTAVHDVRIIDCWLYASGSAGNNIGLRTGNSDANANQTTLVYQGAVEGVGGTPFSIRALSYSVVTSYWAQLTGTQFEAANATLTVYDESTFSLDGHTHTAYFPLLFTLDKGGSDQSVNSSTWTKVTWSNASLDHDSGFDNGNDRFTPNTAGYWHLHAIVQLNALTDGTQGQIEVRKNGTGVRVRVLAAGAVVSLSLEISCTLQANGSTDYFEIFVLQDSGIARDVEGDADSSVFEGRWVRAA